MPFQIIRNDITQVAADAIVNSANPDPTFGAGTDAAIYHAAGAERLLEARRKIGPIPVGQAAATPAFSLPAKYIIHTVGPSWQGGDHGEREAVRSCYQSCLSLALSLGCESIAFPLIATGVYGFPRADALRIAVSVFSDFLAEHEMQITLVVFNREAFVLSGRIFSGVKAFIDENYVAAREEEEYFRLAPRMSMNRPPREEPPMRGKAPARRKPFSWLRSKPGSSPEQTEDNADASLPAAPPPKSPRPPLSPAESIPKDDFPSDEWDLPDAFCADAAAPSAPVSTQEELAAYEVLPQEAPSSDRRAVPVPLPEDAPLSPKRPASASRSLEDVIRQAGETWQQSLLRLIDEKGYTDVEVYKRANVDRKLFSKIRSNPDYQPKKSTAVAFALALRLNLDETRDLLSRAGYALSPSSPFDLIVEYFIDQRIYDSYTINLALFDYHQPLLGA